MEQILDINAIPKEVFEPLENMNYWDSSHERGVNFLRHKLKFRKFLNTSEGLLEFTEASPGLPYGGIRDHQLVFSTKS